MRAARRVAPVHLTRDEMRRHGLTRGESWFGMEVFEAQPIEAQQACVVLTVTRDAESEVLQHLLQQGATLQHLG